MTRPANVSSTQTLKLGCVHWIYIVNQVGVAPMEFHLGILGSLKVSGEDLVML